MDEFNGWSNRETWLASLLLNSNQSGYLNACIMAKSGSRFEAEYDLERMIKGINGHEDIDFNVVNWGEILESLRGVGGFDRA